MAELYGGKLVYGLGVFFTALLTVVSPFAAYWGLGPFLAVRVAEGFTEVSSLQFNIHNSFVYLKKEITLLDNNSWSIFDYLYL